MTVHAPPPPGFIASVPTVTPENCSWTWLTPLGSDAFAEVGVAEHPALVLLLMEAGSETLRPGPLVSPAGTGAGATTGCFGAVVEVCPEGGASAPAPAAAPVGVVVGASRAELPGLVLLLVLGSDDSVVTDVRVATDESGSPDVTAMPPRPSAITPRVTATAAMARRRDGAGG